MASVLVIATDTLGCSVSSVITSMDGMPPTLVGTAVPI
jgi:hypothetical protein